MRLNLTDIFITHGHGDHCTSTTRGQLILWVTARALYGVREHPGQDVSRVVLSSWL
jgi:ribonuclease BN (tRNA processing enzyme)